MERSEKPDTFPAPWAIYLKYGQLALIVKSPKLLINISVMKIIRFNVNHVVDDKNSAYKRMFMEETTFCCPKCDKTCVVNFDGLIFRVLEFYCKNCGSFYKIINPAFAPPSQ